MKSTRKPSPRSPTRAATHARDRPPTRVSPGISIVGVGASAGGLEAFTALLKQLPADTGFGFVLVQHLDPQHESALPQLLARATSMPVHEVTNNLRVAANHVYVIPPNTSLSIVRGVLKLQPRAQHRIAPRAIDFFFEALAKDQRERAIGVILSGTATDGTLGLEAIKAEGGLTFAQDDSAKYPSMPRSAVAAGCVDFVLPPVAIAKELAWIAQHPYVAGQAPKLSRYSNGRKRSGTPGNGTPVPSRGLVAAKINGRGQISGLAGSAAETASAPDDEGYKKILLLLRNHRGVDFSLYKSSTIQRRILRRTLLNRRNTLDDYAAFLPGNTRELDALYSDSLIGVTSFFRNADAFAVLQRRVLPTLLRQAGDEPLRVWVLGCSTGQEAYSIAIAYAEAAEKVTRARKLQMFATDLNETSLEKARHALYAKTLVQDISPERLKRFFVEEDGGYRVIKSLRESVVFARQNVISDPPFSRMDLISCRNLMIYLEPSLQKKVLPTFHYALKPDGFLFLGSSESVSDFTELFAPVDKKQKIFSKRVAPTQAFQLPMHQERGEQAVPGKATTSVASGKTPAKLFDAFPGELNAEREADRVTVNQFAPPGVLINAERQILQFRGATGAYLESPTGKASFDLLKMAREGLMLPLRSTILRAEEENRPVRHEAVPVVRDGKTRLVHVEVVPLKNLKERCFLVLFEDAEKPEDAAPVDAPSSNGPQSAAPHAVRRREDSNRIAQLERELAETRDYLQSIQEHQESANEELQAANEEGQSANEELQSLNEELETSKEELESTNEELTTVNDEMVHRNTELNRLNSDLTNLQDSSKLTIVLLARDQTIRRFSVEAEKQLGLHGSDLGRPMGSVRHNLHCPELSAVIAKVIDGGRETEREVQDKDGRWYLLRVRPYLTGDSQVDGALLVLVDTSAIKEAEQAVVHARDFAEAIIGSVRDPFLILDDELRVQKANPAFFALFKISPAQLVGRTLGELHHGQWAIPELRKRLKSILPRHGSFDNFALTLITENVGRRTLLLNARQLAQTTEHRAKILLGMQDVTKEQALQVNLLRSEKRFRRLFEAAQDGILLLDPVTRKITDANPFIVKLLGYSRRQLIKKELWQIGMLKDETASREAFRVLKANGFIRYENLPLKSKGGEHHEVEFVSNLYDEGGQEVIQCNIRDITERKRSENALRASEARYRSLFDSIDEGFCLIEVLFDEGGTCTDFRYLEVNPSFERQSGVHGATGKRVREITPKLEAHWFETYGKVVRTGKPVRFTDEVKALNRWFDFYAFRVGGKGSRRVAVLFRNVTERKKAEHALLEAREQLAAHAGQLEKMVSVRTAQLTATNRRLLASVDSIRRGKEEYRALLLESEFMQKKLRSLTRLVLTAQEDERREISRELHDVVVQTLVGINVELSALGHAASVGPRALKAKIARTQRLVEKSVNAVHRFARQLRPAVLDDLGLIPALHAYMKAMAARNKLKINFTAFAGVETLNSARRTVLYRVVQEALTNVARHAQASVVNVSIRKIKGAIRLEVQDNGKSFQVLQTLSAKTNRRLGLLGMRERVEIVGGTLVIESAPGRGTTVRTEVPFSPKESP